MSSNLKSRMRRVGAIVAFALLAAGTITATPALAAGGEGCPNEQVRAESLENPTEHQPYSSLLPECRAYEMVSPLDKQGHDVGLTDATVAPEGNAVSFGSFGDFAEANNYSGVDSNPFLAQRAPTGWETFSAFAPASLLGQPQGPGSGGLGEYSSDLSKIADCGTATDSDTRVGTAVVCALREPDGSWVSTPPYASLNGTTVNLNSGVIGGSSDLSTVVFQVENNQGLVHLLPADTNINEGLDGSIYEIVGLGGASPELRLVNVDDHGNVIGPTHETGLNRINETFLGATPLSFGFGGEGATLGEGSRYHAVSADGSTIFFTATPAGGAPTIYARIGASETVAISQPSPSECATCSTPASGAVFQGASADGSKAFFTTDQQLLGADKDTTADLYMYDRDAVTGHNLVQVSGGGAGDLTPGSGAEVQGVVDVSSDGSHVYFVARGVLTTLPNGDGQSATANADNAYVFDTLTGQTRFVAELCSGPEKSGEVADVHCPASLNEKQYPEGPVNDSYLWHARTGVEAQVTPDGGYLVFDTYAKLITSGPEADTNEARQVYRYDFETGKLNRISIGEPSFPASNNGNTPGMDATIAGTAFAETGATGDVNDMGRAISENGEYIVFSTPERLQADDVNGLTGSTSHCGEGSVATATDGCDVYEWHDGVVSMLSDGQSLAGTDVALGSLNGFGAGNPMISASGSDVFFTTRIPLVGQDTDQLADVYDARIGGGLPKPTAATSCSGEACQGGASTGPVLGASGTSSFSGGGNLTPGSTTFPPPTEAKPKPLTTAQKLTKALAACKKQPKKRRPTCDGTARRHYGPKHRASKKS